MKAIRNAAGYAFTVAVAALFSGQVIAAEWDAGAGKDWETLLAAARKEGQVVVSVCPGGMIDTIGKMFKQDTGIDISFVTGTIAELGVKYDTELQSGRVSTDARLSGVSALVYGKRGLLAPVKDMILLPGISNQALWYGGKLGYADTGEVYMPVPAEYVSGLPIINSDAVDASKIATWNDLLKPEFKGKIAAMDPLDGSIGGTMAEYIAKTKGIDFITKLYTGQNVVLVRDRRQLVEWAARGVYPIVLAADAAPEIESFRQAGVTNLKALLLSDGPGNLNGGCSGLTVPAKAPHPNAARVFANWFLSKRGQEAYVAGQHQPSNRLDVAASGVQQNLIPRPGIEYFANSREVFSLIERPALDEAIAKALGK
jgi:ABC-type Fe3+ transport system substrate-binding protein